MHSGNQSKHIRGGQNFDPTRGELTVDPQMLYDRYSGKGQFLKTNAGDWNHKERFTHTETIGIYRSKYTGKEVPTIPVLFIILSVRAGTSFRQDRRKEQQND